MICESCKFDNREGALFCAECGKPLAAANKEESKSDDERTVILDEVVTNSKESVDKEDESEANTTVLTSDMLKPAQSEAPKGFTPGPVPVKPMAPQGAPMSPQPMAPMAPNQAAAPQAPKMPNPQGAPMAPQGQPQALNQAATPQAPKMPAGQPAPEQSDKKADKTDKKADKKAAKAAKKANKGKMGTGAKVYIVISIILILALGGALAYGYFV